MKHRKIVVLLCLILTVLLAAAALSGCAKKGTDKTPATERPATASAAPANTGEESKTPTETEPAPANTGEESKTPTETEPAPSELGEGKLSFRFDVQNRAGEKTSYLIHTDAATVGEALTGLDLVEGEQGDYGLYVTTVCGETLDYNADGMYWAFYENGEYAMTGVDSTAIADGAVYAMVATKG